MKSQYTRFHPIIRLRFQHQPAHQIASVEVANLMLRSALRRAAPFTTLVRDAASLQSRRRRFHALGVSAELADRLRALGITTPTKIQSQSIPLVLNGETDVVIAAETGGGKTLAYLIPVLDQLRRQQLPIDKLYRPVALLLTTSQELVVQIHDVLRRVDPEMARYACALSSTNQQLPSRVCPLLIATPKALMRVAKPRDFAFTRFIVVDEADMLLGGGFERDTKQIVATIRNQPLKKCDTNEWSIQKEATDRDILEEDLAAEKRQTIFSAAAEHATIPDYGKRSVRDFLSHKFPTAQYAVTEHFHRTLPGLDISTYPLENEDEESGSSTRMALVSRILDDAVNLEGNTLVFANSIETADALYDYLSPKRDVLLYHKEVAREERQRILATLQDATAQAVVICTDIAARGLDTTSVRHVVQYEFANDVVSYIHRIGRTGRAGSTGKVSSIVSQQNALVVAKIDEAGADSLHGAFSRKRSLRKKVKKTQREARSE